MFSLAAVVVKSQWLGSEVAQRYSILLGLFLVKMVIYMSQQEDPMLSSLKGHVSVLAGKLDEAGYRDGFCSDARFNGPYGVTESLDGSIIYVSEYSDIRSINRTSCVVKTVAGSYDTSGFKDVPGSMALFDGIDHIAAHPVTGGIYICDYWNNAVRIFSPINGKVSTLAGKETEDDRLSEALLNGPTGIVIDRKGMVYVSDFKNHAVRTISSDGIVSTLAGGDVPGFYDGLKKDAQLRIQPVSV
jgi:hypothetical protein